MRLIQTMTPLQRGFTLVEMMISIALGIIVTGALATFAVSMVRSNSENISMTRLTQDLRASMNVAVREVRRSGYDSNAVTTALSSSDPSAYLTVVADQANSCVTYTYDRGESPKKTESRAFRLNATSGTMQMKVDSAAVDCASGTGWSDVSDPNVVQITKFTPKLMETRFCGELGEYKDSDGNYHAVLARGSVRTLAVCVKGNLRSDSSISRHVSDVIRLRTERLKFNTNEPVDTKCTAAEKAADAVVTVEEWNKECAG